MISLDNRPVEVVEPASPPASSSALSMSPPPASPEIRVTDTPSPPPPPPALSLPSPTSPSATTPFTSATTAHLLFQPFLPSPSPSSPSSSAISPKPHHMEQPKPHHQRALPFSIDNILKPNFGQSLFAIQQGLAAASAFAAVHQQKLQQLQQQQQRQIQQQQQQIKTQEVTKRERKISSPSLSPVTSNKSNNNSSSQPVDLSSKQEQSPSSPSPSSPGSKSDSKDGDVPPGMVRGPNGQLWPAWVFCTRYSDRPSSGPRARKIKKRDRPSGATASTPNSDEKRPRTAFSADQLGRLRREFEENRYLTEERRRNLANDLGLNETQIKIWFQNKRAKLKKSSGEKGDLAKMLAAQGLYNHATVPVDEDDQFI